VDNLHFWQLPIALIPADPTGIPLGEVTPNLADEQGRKWSATRLD
jgi:hypothetical protein